MQFPAGKTLCVSAALILTLAGGCALPGDKAELSRAPSAVQSAVKQAIGPNKLEEFKVETEDGKTVYEAEFEVDDVDHTVTLSDQGEVLEEETDIQLSALPAPVSAAVLKAQPLGHAKEAALVKAGGKTFYEVDVKVGKEKHEIKVEADGTLMSDKVEADECKECKDKD